MDEKPTYREQSLKMICKTRRISKLTPSAIPSLVAWGFRASNQFATALAAPARRPQATFG
jgi:hypothetical protein